MAEKTVPAAEEPREPAREPTRAEESYVAPPVDIHEDEQGLVVVADLPGVESGALDVQVDGGVLTIHARASHVAAGTPVYREFELSGFFRQFQLPEEIEVARISADLKHGVLTLRLPRAARAQPQRIQVRTS